ncbi:MAG: DUF1028 domain-containing protein [Candidatus Eisenbacteria bacterium]|uniref:DUF1028 domain-containing protein n=1 Tax=Eiseniibacteriota bacterium TaxID=2212470 RepID=A0A7Y2EAP0_UNCEI|nr:DUF1028 domain-containing protein [Candidatus Eisenbacteria bacterium]
MGQGIVCLAMAAWLGLGSGAVETRTQEPPVATFSIAACDTLTGEWGVAVASRFLAVGSVVPWAKAGVGAVATQAFANTSFGPDGLKLLEKGAPSSRALGQILALDSQKEARQVGMVDRHGNGATHTGERCQGWAGGVSGKGFAIQGNLLASKEVVDAMAEAFLGSEGNPLAERLLVTIAAGEEAGGDRRGKQSAALLVAKDKAGYGGFNDRYIDLRVDDSSDPIADLRHLYELHAKLFLPAVHSRLGDAALREGDRERGDMELSRAVQLYRDAIRRWPNDAEAKNGLAWFFVEHRVNLDEAMSLAREAYKISPESWQVLDTLAEIYFTKGQLEQAEKLSTKAVEANPENIYLQQQSLRFRTALAKQRDLNE